MDTRCTSEAETTLPTVLAALVHPDKDVRQQAAVGLGQRADPRLAPAIAQLLWRESDFFVRETLTWVLTRTPATATEAATAALADPDASVRLQALHVLSKIADPDSAAVVAALLEDQDLGVVDKARWALARIGDPSVIPLLVDRLGQRDLAGRDAMTTTLAQFGVARSLHSCPPWAMRIPACGRTPPTCCASSAPRGQRGRSLHSSAS